MKRPRQDRVRVICTAAAVLCAAVVFTLLFTAYSRRFDRTLAEENRSRLEEVSGHVAAYMERAVVQQREELAVAAAACAAIPESGARVSYLGAMAEELGFAYIGLAGEDGLLYSTAFERPQDIAREDYFLAAGEGAFFMTRVRRHIFSDWAVTGVILSVPAPAGTGAAVVAMTSIAKLGADVRVDSFDGNGFSYIIDSDGELVLHARSMAYNNLFQAMRNLEFEAGYSLEAMRADILERRADMTAYSDLGVDKYAYYRPMGVNDWTVVSIVPQGVVTARTAALSRELILMCAVAGLVFLGLLTAVGLLLLRLESRRRANRAKSDFLANMSHDMRTPLNAIIGMTAIAGGHAGEPDAVRSCLGKIDSASRHLLGLINDVLDMSRIESGRMTLSLAPFTLPRLLESVQDMTVIRMEAKGQYFSLRSHGVKHAYLTGDSLRLSQIMVNILTNASKFTPEGGHIALDVEELPSDEPGAALFRFTFTDDGIGMKSDFMRELFTPFTRERDSRVDSTEGSGLGMSITKRLVELMGGLIEVRSQVGQGSVFTVTLPLSIDRAAPEAPEPCAPPPAAGFSGRRFLLAEDNALNLEIIQSLLSEAGAATVCAKDGVECVKQFEDSPVGSIDLILMDIQMPRMNGCEAAARIRALSRPDARLPILAMSANAFAEDIAAARDAGMDGYLTKPIDVAVWMGEIKNHLA